VAFSVVDTHIQNPARRKGRTKTMAKKRRKMSAKQIRHFGTKRQKAALRAKRSAPKHRARTRPNLPRKRKAVKRVAKRSAVKCRKNPTPAIVLWGAGNPAKRRSKVAKTHSKKRRAAAKRANTAGRRHTKKVVRHRRRSNPAGLGRPMDWLQGGAGVIAGVVGTRAIPQMVLGPSNTGPMGYLANAIAALGLGWLAHAFLKRPVITTAVIAGGFAGLLSRIIADKTPFGAQLSLSGGLGDWGLGLYQKSNFPYPPRLQNGRLPSPGSSMYTWGDGSQGRAMASAGGSDSTANC
jgi:hypothetical protein